MEQRLFFNGIHRSCQEAPIGEYKERIVFIATGSAISDISWGQATAVRAQIAAPHALA
jgi:hypothetical protein